MLYFDTSLGMFGKRSARVNWYRGILNEAINLQAIVRVMYTWTFCAVLRYKKVNTWAKSWRREVARGYIDYCSARARKLLA